MNGLNTVPLTVNVSLATCFCQARITLKMLNQTYNFPVALLCWKTVQVPQSGLRISRWLLHNRPQEI